MILISNIRQIVFLQGFNTLQLCFYTAALHAEAFSTFQMSAYMLRLSDFKQGITRVVVCPLCSET